MRPFSLQGARHFLSPGLHARAHAFVFSLHARRHGNAFGRAVFGGGSGASSDGSGSADPSMTTAAAGCFAGGSVLAIGALVASSSARAFAASGVYQMPVSS